MTGQDSSSGVEKGWHYCPRKGRKVCQVVCMQKSVLKVGQDNGVCQESQVCRAGIFLLANSGATSCPSGWGKEEPCTSGPSDEFYCLCPEGDTQFPERKLLQDKESFIHTRLGPFPKIQGQRVGREYDAMEPLTQALLSIFS